MSVGSGGGRWRWVPRRPGGFTLLEVVVAIVILQVGLLAVVGLLQLAAREVALARLREAAQWHAGALADSIVAGRAGDSGERSDAWGTLRWFRDAGGIVVEGWGPAGPDTGAQPLVRIWLARAAGDGAGEGAP